MSPLPHRWRGRRVRLTLVAAAVAALGAVAVAPAAFGAPSPINLSSSSCPTLIQQGEYDGCVVELQNLLNQHGAGVSVDGDFGPGTLAAVRTFQSQTGLAVDGVVGPMTKAALYVTGSSGVPAPVNLNSPGCPTYLSQGATGGCVTELQNLLNDRGAHLVLDAQFGPATLAAVKSFQSSNGLTVDGVVGPNTKNSLYNGASPVGAVDLRSPSCPSLMQQGEIDGCVKTLQALLNGKGQSIAVDGDFGPNTLSAVKAFQSGAGLSVDGVVGPNTKNALYSNISGSGGSGAPAPVQLTSGSCPTLVQQGEHDGCVTELQSLLNQHGATLAVDGQFGPATFAAVENYQARVGLSVDGVVGPNTKSALYGGTIVPPPSGGSTYGCAIPPTGSTACATGSSLAGTAATIALDLYNPPGDSQMAAYVRGVFATQPGGYSSLSGVPYAWDGGHPGGPGLSYGSCSGYTGSIQPCPASSTIGLDCSGFVRWMYQLAGGIEIGTGGDSSTNGEIISRYSQAVSSSQLVPGDLIFWGPSVGDTRHVAMYLGTMYVPGEGTGPAIMEARQTGTNVAINLLSTHGTPIAYRHYSD
jgi:peptidoglycan hydrolase-like protein with peptidoglycan-binding domain